MMMSTEQLRQAHKLLAKIEVTERLQAAYREAGEIVVAVPVENRQGLPIEPQHKVNLTADEIGEHVVSVLERRVAAMREELHKFGVA
jgi:prephenate dehydrogenase